MMDKESKILEAALQSFVSRGFHGSSTASIAQKADVSNGTLFHYFRSKETLVQRLHQSVKSEQISFISSGMEELRDPKEQIKQIWTQSINWAMQNTDKYHFLYQYKFSPFRKQHKSDVNEFKKRFYDVVEKGIQQKQIRYMPDDFIFDVTSASVYGMVEYLRANPIKYRTPEFMRQSFECFWDGIKA